jgi:hypothetical protein
VLRPEQYAWAYRLAQSVGSSFVLHRNEDRVWSLWRMHTALTVTSTSRGLRLIEPPHAKGVAFDSLAAFLLLHA